MKNQCPKGYEMSSKGVCIGGTPVMSRSNSQKPIKTPVVTRAHLPCCELSFDHTQCGGCKPKFRITCDEVCTHWDPNNQCTQMGFEILFNLWDYASACWQPGCDFPGYSMDEIIQMETHYWATNYYAQHSQGHGGNYMETFTCDDNGNIWKGALWSAGENLGPSEIIDSSPHVANLAQCSGWYTLWHEYTWQDMEDCESFGGDYCDEMYMCGNYAMQVGATGAPKNWGRKGGKISRLPKKHGGGSISNSKLKIKKGPYKGPVLTKKNGGE